LDLEKESRHKLRNSSLSPQRIRLIRLSFTYLPNHNLYGSKDERVLSLIDLVQQES
jgi:hypothetical protein